MRNAELPWEVERHEAHPYIPHSTLRIPHCSQGLSQPVFSKRCSTPSTPA